MAKFNHKLPVRIKATGTRVYHSGYDKDGYSTFSVTPNGRWGAGMRYSPAGRPIDDGNPWGDLENFEESPFADGTDPLAQLREAEEEKERQAQIIQAAANELRKKKAKERKERAEQERLAQLQAEQDALAEQYASVEAWGMF